LAGLQAHLTGAPGLDVRVRALANGNADPLHGLEQVPDIVVLRFQADQTAELTAWAAAQPESRPPLIVVGPAGNAEVMRLAVRSGARDFLAEPVGKNDLLAALEQVREDLRGRAATARGAVHAFIGASGGVGSSLIAANVAHLLAVTAQRSAVIVDMDLNFAPIAHHLDLHGERGILEALEALESLDAHALAGYGALHRSGLRLYASTTQHVVLGKDVSASRLARFFDLLARHHQHLVIDLPHSIDDLTATALGIATEIYIVMQQSTLNARNAARLVRILRDELMVSPERIRLYINRYTKSGVMQIEDVVRTVGVPVAGTLPSHYKQMLESSDVGMPLYDADRRAPITKSLLQIVQNITGSQSQERHSLLQRALPAFLRS
jgi:pilus assembly protein CpaE